MSPFSHEHADPWAADFVDVPSLNREVSDAIADAVTEIRDRDQLHSHSILVLGPAGAGKTHLFARLRRQLGPRAAFVLLRPELGADATARHVLSHLVRALRRTTLTGLSDTQTQLDIVVGSAFAAVREGASRNYPHLVLEELASLDEDAREEAIEDAVEALEERFEDLDADWLETFLRAPFMKKATRRAALTWLSGLEPNERALRRIGYSAAMADEAILPALRTLGVLASFGAPIVLVFDQLENLVEPGDDARILAHANLLAELHDTVRGLVLVQMALDGVWSESVSPLLNEAARSRLEKTVLFTRMPDAAQREALVKAWTAGVDDEAEPSGDFPWPFQPADWERIAGATVMTPRMLMKACRDALAGGVVLAAERGEGEEADDGGDRLEELWEAQLAQARAELDRAWKEHEGLGGTRLTGALMAALRLEGVKLQQPKAKKAKYQLRVLAPAGERLVYVMQQPHPRSVGAVLKDAVANAESRGVLVLREQAMAFPPRWKKATEHLERLQGAARGVWMPLDRQALARLLAAHDFLAAARSQDLTGEDGAPLPEARVQAWMRERLEVGGWPAVAAARGERKGDADEGAVSAAPASPTPAPAKAGGQAQAVLAQLGVASIDRIVRELRQAGGAAGRREVREALEGAAGVTFFGREIAYWRGGEA
ncbi:MAG TPA: hypothetical protein RMH85_16515 [Polyangiaceae bacterium LLY-WYZ-15_(1-7)]|nr:hypothetical protein [Polyangiaceae bacterium LLY-WYZ-15_(1-7)]HJL10105.1 hypothetical protein [Polyangiaceae bacterium LLY-WYZ-15_(1-7)]